MLDDFFAEADQHLLNVRQALVRLESSIGSANPDSGAVEELFQNFHSFKGISAIVGLTAAETVAHAAEDLLRSIKSGKVPLTRNIAEAMSVATLNLEQTVAAFRSGSAAPENPAIAEQLSRHSQAAAAPAPAQPAETATAQPGAAADFASRCENARRRGMLLWKSSFAPSRELRDRGVTIDSVRGQLSRFGEILRCVPKVKGKGEIAFDFLVGAQDGPADPASWQAQGIVLEPVSWTDLEATPTPGSTPASPAQADPLHNPFLAPSHTVRVDLKHLDELMRIAGEMVINRSRLEAQLARLNGGRTDLRGVHEVTGSLGRSLRDLRQAIMRVRMVPVAEIFARMPFVVQDLSRQSEKKVRLKLEGQNTAIDKYLVERLKEPLLHLVRNSFSHGVETPSERAAASKPPEATIELRAQASGDSVILIVKDDGRGIDSHAVLEKASRMGLPLPSNTRNPDNASILKILCASGFSTRDDADRAAGRGIGMAIVADTIRELGGSLTLESEKGRGTQFTLRLPLTLAIADAIIFRAAGQTCAIPQSCVREILQVDESQIENLDNVEGISYRTGVLPVLRLTNLFRKPKSARAKMFALVVTTDRGSTALLAEELLGLREVVVQALRDPLIQVPGVAGATELGDGKPVLILDAAGLTAGAVMPPQQRKSREDLQLQEHP